MNKLYFAIFIAAGFCGAYLSGSAISDAKCRARFAQEVVKQTQESHIQQRNIKKENHDKVYKTGNIDIRHILHDKYTILQ